ncbi:plasmid replication protein RepC [Thioclava sp. GXIMD4215]|uniref:plasmid replication protein RepC n=1 Tax=Thioclava sp. GXIMD4215 TaxID=3131928 RepID=UPI00311B20CB
MSCVIKHMGYQPISPFKRPIAYEHIQALSRTNPNLTNILPNKWDIFRELSKAREAFDLSSKELMVLQALVSFHPSDILEISDENSMIVFPSNASLSERLHGMAPSTIRRHLARLVQAGFIIRRDSPNGKRYRRRAGAEQVSFGFDLSPMVHRAEEINSAALRVEEAAATYAYTRERVKLLQRDVLALATYAAETKPEVGIWDQFKDSAKLVARDLRKKLNLDALKQIQVDLEAQIAALKARLQIIETTKVSTSDAQNEHHQQRSNIENLDTEDKRQTPKQTEQQRNSPNITLEMVARNCRSIADYCSNGLRDWEALHTAACLIVPMMGITKDAWNQAQKVMGPYEAAVTIAAMLEHVDTIRSPGGYLRKLTAKATNGLFSSSSMVLAISNKTTEKLLA